MVVGHAEPFAQVCEGGGGIGGVVEEGLTVLDFATARVFVLEAGAPLGEQGGEFGFLVLVLEVEGVEVEVFFGAGDEFAEDGFAVGGEGEAFEETGVTGGGEQREAADEEGGEEQ